MTAHNPWFILTSDEMREICSHLSRIEEQGSPGCRESARTARDILTYARGRLV